MKQKIRDGKQIGSKDVLKFLMQYRIFEETLGCSIRPIIGTCQQFEQFKTITQMTGRFLS